MKKKDDPLRTNKQSKSHRSTRSARNINLIGVILISLITACLVLFIRTQYADLFGGNKNTYIIFYPLVMISALVGGWISSITVLTVFAIGSAWFLLPPVETLWIDDRHDLIGFIIFTVVGIIISLLIETFRKTKQKYELQSQYLVRLSEELRASKDQMQTILENVADGIVVRNRKGNPVYANRAALELFDASPSQNKRFLTLNEIDRQFTITNADGKKIRPSSMPVGIILRGEKYAEGTLCFRNKKTKKETWYMTRAKGIYNSKNILEYIVVVFVDITERRMIEKQKDDFIGIASHELKTPITSLKAYTQALQFKLRKEGHTKTADYLVKMDNQISRLTILIGDLLDITKMKGGRLSYNQTLFDINQLILEVAEELQPTIKKHTFKLELSETALVKADKARIGQVLTNFLTNAVKYSPHANTVIIQTKRYHNNIIVCVRDFGEGISTENQKKVFDMFYRDTDAKAITIPGLGLGLYISSEIIKSHGGKIWVESREGEGSLFSFSLQIYRPTKERV